MNRFKFAALVLFAFTFCCGLHTTRATNFEGPQVASKPAASKQAGAQTQVKQAVQFKPDKVLVYKKIKDVQLKLHVFEPNGHQATDQAPAIVFFFGGGWNGGTPRQFYEQAEFFTGHGYVAISAEYRVKKTHGTTPFECVEDGKSAVRWIRSHAKELGVNPDNIVASGGSAGGHVAACTGVIEGCEGKDEDLSISSLPSAMILYNPVLDTTEKGYGAKKFSKERKTELSPNHHIRAGIVPTIIFHGTADKTVPFENAQTFARLMEKAGNQCQLESYEGKGHGFFNGKFFRPKTKDTSGYEDSVKKSLEFLIGLDLAGKESEPQPANPK